MAEVQARQQPEQQIGKEAQRKEEAPKFSYGINAIYNKKLGNMLQHGPILSVRSDETVRDAFSILAARHLTSAPVLDVDTNQYQNYVDMLDILSLLLSLSGKEIPKSGESMKLSQDDITNMISKKEEFLNTKLSKVAGLVGRHPVVTLRKDQTIENAIESYLKGCQRILITNEEGSLLGVISQSAMAKYLEDNLHRIKFDPCFKDNVWNFPYKTTSVKVVNKNVMVLDAFAQMRANNLQCVGVVNDDGKLVGNLSASDLQSWFLFGMSFKRLAWSVERFLKTARRQQARNWDFVVSVPRETSVFALLKMFYLFRVHRIYIVDENGKPSGIISLTDIMKGLSAELHQHYVSSTEEKKIAGKEGQGQKEEELKGKGKGKVTSSH